MLGGWPEEAREDDGREKEYRYSISCLCCQVCVLELRGKPGKALLPHSIAAASLPSSRERAGSCSAVSR